MSVSSERMAALRAERKRQGLAQSTIWLSKEDRILLDKVIEERQLKNQSDAIRLALHTLAKEQNSMTT